MRKLPLVACVFAGIACGERLAPTEQGVPAELGGDVRAEQRGSHIHLEARLPEPGGKVLARSIGKNPVWEKDALASPELEDRVRWVLRYTGAGGGRSLSIEVNPWGAYRIEEAGEVLKDTEIRRRAEVTALGWTVEASVPVGLLDLDWNSPRVRVEAERIRSRRALAPEFRWRADLGSLTVTRAGGPPPPDLPEPRLGNTDPPLEIGRLTHLPPVVATWDSPEWRDVPGFELPRNEPFPRAPRYRTQVKWVHDGRTLALLARLEEPEPVVARAGGRDSAVTADDHLALYLATSGSKFVQIAINTVGALLDSLGSGPHISRPQSAWNAYVERQADILHRHWIARVNVPLDECAAALGETSVPKHWRILLARHRAPRPGEAAEWSTLPPLGGTTTFYGPARYQAMVLKDDDPGRVKPPPALQSAPVSGLSAELAALDSRVWPPLYRRYHSVRTMVQDYLRKKVEEAVLAERRAFEQVASRQDWERFREERLASFRKSAGALPAERTPLQTRVTARRQGDGYRLENLVWQSRPGFWMTANLYLPAKPSAPMPAIVIVHSQHYPKTQGELHDMGELWARAGCAVLIIERPGYGERTETTPWFRQAYGSRFNFTRQLFLIGESYSGWAAWDVIRSVDFLYERPEVDRNRIILLGSVAGGGEIAGVAAALDPRITAVVPFNYDQGHVRVHGDLPGQIAGQFSPWLLAASVAPRRFVRAFEFGWEGAEEPDYPDLWVDGMQRSEKVWGFYGARESLASSRGYGLIRLSMERVSHCFSIGPQQREDLYPILQRWFQIPYPSEKDRNILPDSQLSTNPLREEARRQEAARRRPHADLLSLPPVVATELPRKAMHQLALEMARQQLEAARKQRVRLREELKPVLGEIDPPAAIRVESIWKRSLSGAVAEGWSLTVEEGIRVPLLLIRPPDQKPAPVVVAVAQAGKERFLTDRTREIESLLRAGIAICLPDVRATGETAPSPDRGDGGPYHRIAETEFDLGRSLLGSRLKDLRAVLAWLRQRPGLDPRNLALWGDSFSPPNPPNLWLDELEFPGGPQIQYRAEPMGAHLALLAALYEDSVRAIAARGGLVGYLAVLESAVAYVPIEDVLLGVLNAGDVPDIAAALAPAALRIEAPVNGRNIRLAAAEAQRALEIARTAYREAGTPDRLVIQSEPEDISAWLIGHLKQPGSRPGR
jgi:dienelactone hydrolase